MRTVLAAVSTIFLFTCGNSGIGPDPDAPHDGTGSGSGSGSDGGAGSDGAHADSQLSYAPCDTCCDPIAQDCGATEACHPENNGTTATCKAVGTKPVGATCGVDMDCMRGTTCLSEDVGIFNCFQLCIDNSVCPSAHPTCQFYPVPAGRAPYGICF